MEMNPQLVAKAKAGDKDAFAQMYEHIYKDLYKYAYYMLNNPEDAKDIVADTVYDAYKGLRNLKDDDKFCNWIVTILANKCKMKRKWYTEQAQALSEDIPDKTQDLEQKYDVEKAMEMLEEEERQVVVLAMYGGFKSKEIGEYMNMKATTIRSKLSRALSKMGKYLEVI